MKAAKPSPIPISLLIHRQKDDSKKGIQILSGIGLKERKDHIANIATQVFSAKGYQSATLQDISRKTQLRKAGMYYYFKSKADILAYILMRHSDEFLNLLKLCIKKK